MDAPEGNLVIVERCIHERNTTFRAGSMVGSVMPTDSKALHIEKLRFDLQ